MGLQRLFLAEERRRVPDRPLSVRAKIDLGFPGHVHHIAPHPRRALCRPDPPGPDRHLARSQDARDLECARAGTDRHQPRRQPGQPAVHGHGAHGPAQGRGTRQGRCQRRAHRAPARAWRQLRHQGPLARLQDLLPGLCRWRGPVGGRSALQPGRWRNHLLRRDRDGRLGTHEGVHHQGRHGQVRHQESHLQAQPHRADLQRLCDL